MQTHGNDDHLRKQMDEILAATGGARERLEQAAERAQRLGLSGITAGEPGERPLRQWEKYGVHVVEYGERETDADLNMVRISVGGSFTEGVNYCVFRGPIGQVKDVLRRALNALRDDG